MGDNGKLEIYKAVRAHELELNRATAAFEHAVLAPLYLLNGGGAVAFLTLLGAIAQPDASLDFDRGQAGLAVGFWTFGLLVALVATWFGFHGQRGFAKLERLRRTNIETDLVPVWQAKLRIISTANDDPGDVLKTASRWQAWYTWLVPLSGVLFVAGVVAAAVSLL